MRDDLSTKLERLVLADPRGRSEAEWLDVMEFALTRLTELAGPAIEVGEYWLDVGATSASASLGARIRASGPLLWTTSDCWEAAFCISGGIEGAHVDVFAFPFLKGSTINRAGRIEDLADDKNVDEFWLHYADGRWEERGWR